MRLRRQAARSRAAVRRRRQPAPFVVGVAALRHDAAAADARRPPPADDPARDPLRPEGGQRRATRVDRGGRAHRGRCASARSRPSTGHPRWGDFGLDADGRAGAHGAPRPAVARRRDPLLLRGLRRRARASRAGATSRLPTRGRRRGSSAALPEARVHPHHPRRPRCGAVAERGELGPGRHHGRGARSGSTSCARPAGGPSGCAGGTYMEVRYEDLVTDPEPVLRQVAEFVGLPWSDEMLNYPSAPRSGCGARWCGAEAPGRRHDHRRGARPPARARVRAARARAGPVAGGPRCHPRTARRSRRSRAACSRSSATRSNDTETTNGTGQFRG